MATITTTNRVDDLDGSRADIMVALTIDSKRYRVDLSRANYNAYIAPLVRAARPLKMGRPAKQTANSWVARGPLKKTASKVTEYSRLTARDQTAIRAFMKRTRGRVSDSDVAAWKSRGKP